MTCRIGSKIGLPDIRPESFENAITEPVKVTAPMATPSDISRRLPALMPTLGSVGSTRIPNADGA